MPLGRILISPRTQEAPTTIRVTHSVANTRRKSQRQDTVRSCMTDGTKQMPTFLLLTSKTSSKRILSSTMVRPSNQPISIILSSPKALTWGFALWKKPLLQETTSRILYLTTAGTHHPSVLEQAWLCIADRMESRRSLTSIWRRSTRKRPSS